MRSGDKRGTREQKGPRPSPRGPWRIEHDKVVKLRRIAERFGVDSFKYLPLCPGSRPAGSDRVFCRVTSGRRVLKFSISSETRSVEECYRSVKRERTHPPHDPYAIREVLILHICISFLMVLFVHLKPPSLLCLTVFFSLWFSHKKESVVPLAD